MLLFGILSQLCVILLISLRNFTAVSAQCGAGNTTGPLILTGSGYVSSPNFPNNYTNDADCEWLLIADENSVVTLTIVSFATQTSWSNNYDTLHIKDGNTESGNWLAQLTGLLSTPRVYVSTQRYMLLNFVSDYSKSDRGFNATFSSNGFDICISSPCRNDGTCSKMGSGYACSCRSGFTGTNCEINIDDCVSGPCLNNGVCIDEVDGYSCACQSDFTGDTCQTAIERCNGAIVEMFNNGTVNSPNYPSAYPADNVCQWRITAFKYVSIVQIVFEDIQIEANDFISIHDGQNQSATEIARLSGSLAMPIELSSTKDYMFLNFVSDKSNVGRGFRATFLSTGLGCTAASRPREYTASSGSIASPHHAFPYNNNANCLWRITAARSDEIVRISFTNFFTELCCDFVSVYDGPDTDSPLLARLSGSQGSGKQYYTTQRSMVVQLTTDSENGASGFSADYYTTQLGCTASTSPRIFYGSGWVSSPNFPIGYPLYSDCTWQLVASEHSIVSLTLISFNTTANDRLSIYDGANSSTYTLLTQVIGSQSAPRVYTSTQKYMTLRFIAVPGARYPGFNATFVSTDVNDCATSPCQNGATCIDLVGGFRCECDLDFTGSNCESTIDECDVEKCEHGGTCIDGIGNFICVCLPGFTGRKCETGDACSPEGRPLQLTGNNGEILTSSYPSNYENSADCQWQIHVASPNSIVNLVFSDLNTESCCDLITLHDGVGLKSRLITSLSGTGPITPGGYNSTQPYMFIRFTSDSTVTARGFRAEFTGIAVAASD